MSVTTEWKDVGECRDLSEDELDVQMKLRADLIGQMVGTLYPGILQGEIGRLGWMKSELRSMTVKECGS